MSTARLVLSFPISVNGMFPTRGNSRVPSPRYRAWRDEAGWRVAAQKPARIFGPVNIRIDLVAPDNRLRDAANYEKGVTDLLVKHGVIEGDDHRFVRRVSIGWEDSGEPCTITITACNPTNQEPTA
ncbi:RusA family crossover junction endodeoxyribonuclease [Aureimonas pseudogalii]|uniref:Holliday junction resolvase RusA-like endonuclease n=1 Tax=Aureimonas pseudogalii TaxID=1744844 RepID=A0A7W6E9J7_9HYPH|nr:RusA family crossover junction endodeoxyribonuclease [Aureimonas pseudogalii]MBB3997223.1 Holliday junction resolvase RusA-like endonuclease [Aureimonas pseudogalii]